MRVAKLVWFFGGEGESKSGLLASGGLVVADGLILCGQGRLAAAIDFLFA